MPFEIVVYDGAERMKSLELPGEVDNYDIIIKSTEDVKFPPKQKTGEVPQVPDIEPSKIEKRNNRKAYKRMVESDTSQPAKVRRFIHERQVMTRRQMDLWANQEGYAPRSGGMQTALIVLDNVTGEIDRIGDEDEDQRIVWTGE